MNWLRQRSCVLVFAVLEGLPGFSQSTAAPSEALLRRLDSFPNEATLAGGNLHVVNLYKTQASILLRSQNRPPAEIVDHLARDVYAPYASFWQGYLGDEAAFKTWARTKLLAPDHPIRSRLPAVLALDLDALFTHVSQWVYQVSGKQPRGTWYLAFGPGWTDMGGLGDIGMVLDFTRQEPNRDAIDFILPHELTHQVNGTRPRDPDHGTVLERIVSEGLGSYAAYVYAAGTKTPAECLLYTADEWQWSLAHEKQLIAAARPYLASKDRQDDNRLAARNQRLIEEGPAAAGYFLGFRIMQAYAEKHGPKSWTEAIDLPVRKVLEKSGYPL